MKLGLFGINFGLCADPDVLCRVARAAEDAGFESLWTGEHVVLPDPQAPPSPSPPQTPFLDPAVALSHAAAVTRTIRLGTGIVILPQRNPVVLAKELASVDVVSKGRLLFGLGVGYLEAEFRAIGAPFEDRGPYADEAVAVMKALWTQWKPAHHGRFFSFHGIDAQPRPVQKPHPPIIVGGGTRAGARRAARLGNGWYGFLTDPEATRRSIGWIRESIAAGERPEGLGPVEITFTPPPPLTADTIARYEDLGVSRLVALAPARTASELVGLVEGFAALPGVDRWRG